MVKALSLDDSLDKKTRKFPKTPKKEHQVVRVEFLNLFIGPLREGLLRKKRKSVPFHDRKKPRRK